MPTTAPPKATSGPAAPNGPAGKKVNYRSIDPCTFFATDTFDPLDESVHGELSYVDLAGCHLILVGTNAKNEHHNWSVAITMDYRYITPAELAAGTPGSYTATTRAGVPVIAGKSSKGDCLRVFQLPGGFASVVIEVKSAADPCKAADLGLASAVAAVKDGDLEPATWPKNSLVPQDLCAVLKTAAGDALRSSAAGTPKGLHTCTWRSPDNHVVSMNLEATPNSAQVVTVILGGKGDGAAYRDGFLALLTAIATGH